MESICHFKFKLSQENLAKIGKTKENFMIENMKTNKFYYLLSYNVNRKIHLKISSIETESNKN
jgi:hypothetical protein